MVTLRALTKGTAVVAVALLACTGSAGPQGSPGPVGPTGPQGTPGPQGVPGPTGAAGEAGAPGEPGAAGATGATGPQGLMGLEGAPGKDGIDGLPGMNGATGPTGAMGPTGATGATGAAGTFTGQFAGDAGVSGNFAVEGTLTLALGDSATKPATSCAALLSARPGIASGPYWLKPTSAAAPFRAYCDMTNQGGGWTLVWSNLRGGRSKVTADIQWTRAINTLPLSNGEVTADLESFTVFTGLKHYTPLAPGSLMRYDWATDYGQAIEQRQICPFIFSNTATYQITFNIPACSQPIGSVAAGLFVDHNNNAFTTYDRDLDTYSTNCSALYGNTPWWYYNCWSGNINGGGETSTNHVNGAYWSGAANQWGAAGGVGGGNGWLYVK